MKTAYGGCIASVRKLYFGQIRERMYKYVRGCTAEAVEWQDVL